MKRRNVVVLRLLAQKPILSSAIFVIEESVDVLPISEGSAPCNSIIVGWLRVFS